MAEYARYENPKMFKLESVLLQQFGPAAESRAILFSKTRKSTHCLLDWVRTNGALQGAGIKAAILTGSGIGLSHMTQVRSDALERSCARSELSDLSGLGLSRRTSRRTPSAISARATSTS